MNMKSADIEPTETAIEEAPIKYDFLEESIRSRPDGSYVVILKSSGNPYHVHKDYCPDLFAQVIKYISDNKINVLPE